MSDRTAKFVLAIFASLLAGAPLTTVAHSAVPSADDCLSAPKNQTPQAGHWYYRIDRATKRHCWFLGEAGAKVAQRAQPNSSRPAKPVSPQAESTMQPSVADAHAELPGPTAIERPNQGDALAAAIPMISGAEPRRSIVASRWPDQSLANPSTNPTPNQGNSDTGVKAAERTQPSSVLSAGQFAAADMSSQTSSYSLPMLLAAILGALALAGILASVILKFGGTRRPRQTNLRERRDAIWQSTDNDSTMPPAKARADNSTRWTDFSRELDQAGDPNDRIAQFFSQLRAPT